MDTLLLHGLWGSAVRVLVAVPDWSTMMFGTRFVAAVALIVIGVVFQSAPVIADGRSYVYSFT